MKDEVYCLGIDTSNYTTSAAIVDGDLNVVCDSREILKVKKGDRGLRQSQALFEHICNLPHIIEKLELEDFYGKIKVISVSDKPRQIEGSYMPVFKAGETVGKSLASIIKGKYLSFSHQEGHIQAAKASSKFEGREFLSLHLSGGTTEVLKCTENYETGGYHTEIVGGTKDISFGQLIDRVGVSLGLNFPCGKQMDEYALKGKFEELPKNFCKIKAENGMMNISGIETQIQRYIEDVKLKNELTDREMYFICRNLFYRIGEAIELIIEQSRKNTGVFPVVIAGGVASSSYIREVLDKYEGIYFGSRELSSDNAVGVAMLGMKRFLEGRAILCK